jgi:hypothetical protein
MNNIDKYKMQKYIPRVDCKTCTSQKYCSSECADKDRQIALDTVQENISWIFGLSIALNRLCIRKEGYKPYFVFCIVRNAASIFATDSYFKLTIGYASNQDIIDKFPSSIIGKDGIPIDLLSETLPCAVIRSFYLVDQHAGITASNIGCFDEFTMTIQGSFPNDAERVKFVTTRITNKEDRDGILQGTKDITIASNAIIVRDVIPISIFSVLNYHI